MLGVAPGASPEEVAAAYRDLAKAWHPDRRGEAGEDKMAEINVAYDLLRAGEAQQHASRRPGPAPAAGPAGKGAGLSPAVRRALGPELLVVHGEADRRVRLQALDEG